MDNHGNNPLPHPHQPLAGPWPPTWVMGAPAPPHHDPPPATSVPVEYIPFAVAPIYKNSAHSPPPVTGVAPSAAARGHAGSTPYPYVYATPAPRNSTLETVLKVLEQCGKKLEENTRKAGTACGNVWHHLKTNPSVTDAAMARLAQGTKVLAEGGHDKVFQKTFGIFPGEKLKKAYACYLSTSSGPVIGTIYITTERLAFCSDNPLCHNIGPGQQEWIYYKVVVPLDQLKAVNPSFNRQNPADKHIQIITAGNHEFWFMGFVSYDKALKNMLEALQHQRVHHSQNLHH